MQRPWLCRRLALATALAASLAAGAAHAQDRPNRLDVLVLDATVSTEVTPDLARVMPRPSASCEMY
jgi:predicted secreted protein